MGPTLEHFPNTAPGRLRLPNRPRVVLKLAGLRQPVDHVGGLLSHGLAAPRAPGISLWSGRTPTSASDQALGRPRSMGIAYPALLVAKRVSFIAHLVPRSAF